MRSPRWLRRLIDIAELHRRILELNGRIEDMERHRSIVLQQLRRTTELAAAAEARCQRAQRTARESDARAELAEQRMRAAEDAMSVLLLERGQIGGTP